MNNALNQVTNVFREARNDLHLSREKVSELSVFLSPRQIEKIEKDQLNPRPEDVLILADLYRRPKLINHYCSSICPIGKRQIPNVPEKTLPEIITTVLICSEYLECNRPKLQRLIAPDPVCKLTPLIGEISTKELSNVLAILCAEAIALSMWIYNNDESTHKQKPNFAQKS